MHQVSLVNTIYQKSKEWVIQYPWFTTGLIFTFVFLISLWPVLSMTCMPMWDASDLHYPNYTYIFDSFREGRIPFWDPYTKSGGPFHAEPYQPILNPFIYLLTLFPISTYLGFILFCFAHWWIAGAGMIWLSKAFGSSPSGALVAAISFCFSGFFVGHASHIPFIVTIAWVPWIFGLASLGISRKNFAYFLLAGSALAMSALGGYPPFIAFSGLALGLWLVLRHPQEWRRILIGLTISGLILVVVALPSLHAFLTEGVGHTSRDKAMPPLLANFGHPFAPTAAFSLIFPFAAFMTRGTYDADITMADAYCGILAFPFIFYWWFKGSQKKPIWWLIFVLFMFVVSLGGRAGLRTLLYYVFPPLQFIRFSSQFRAFWIFALSLAAGLGFSCFSDDLIKKRDLTLTWLKVFLTKYLIFIALVAVGLIVFQIIHKGNIFLFASFLPAGIILPLVFYTLKSSKNITLALLSLIIVDMVAHVHINHGSIWDTGNPLLEIAKLHQERTLNLGEPGARKEAKDIKHSSAIQVKKEANVWGFTAMINDDYNNLSTSAYASILTSPHRFWLSPSIRNNINRADELKILSKISINDPVPVFFEPKTEDLKEQEVVQGSFGEVQTLLFSPERIELNVIVPGKNDVALVSTERWGNSWKAQVDGAYTPVYTANVLFRGLIMKPGRHVVIWTYEPPYWKFLAAIAEIVLFGSLLLGLFLIRFTKSKTQSLTTVGLI